MQATLAELADMVDALRLLEASLHRPVGLVLANREQNIAFGIEPDG